MDNSICGAGDAARADHGIEPSVDTVADAYDNAMAEALSAR